MSTVGIYAVEKRANSAPNIKICINIYCWIFAAFFLNYRSKIILFADRCYTSLYLK